MIWTLSAGDIRFSLMAYVPAWVRPPWDRSYAVGGYDGALLLAGGGDKDGSCTPQA